MSNKIRTVIGIAIMIASIVIAAYVGIWCMFIQPIINACQAFDAGTLTGMIVGTTVLKCIFSSAVSSIIIYVGHVVGALVGDF